MILKYISIAVCGVGCLQGLILIAALKKVSKSKGKNLTWLMLFLLAVSITLGGRIMYLYPNIVSSTFPLFTDFILFLYGPLFYFFVRGAFAELVVSRRIVLHFLPAIIHVVLTLPLIMLPKANAHHLIQTSAVFNYLIAIVVIALVHNIIYWIVTFKYIRNKKKEHQGTTVTFDAYYVDYVKWLFGTVILLFTASVIIYLEGISWADNFFQMTWIVASWFALGFVYLVVAKPDSFGDYLVRVKNQVVRSEREQAQMVQLAPKVEEMLETQRVYLNTELSLIGLAKMLDVNTVILSKTINQEFDLGFYDLVNQYRVKEFIELGKDPANSRFTYFALAMRAGFNSKTSFNKYFKKQTGLTPKQYFRKLEVA